MPFFKQSKFVPMGVSKWVRKVLGDKCNLAPDLMKAMGPGEARRLLRRAGSTIKDPDRRLRYVRGAIERAMRVKELTKWLDENHDPNDYMMGDLDRAEYAEFCAEEIAVELELDILTGGRPGYFVMMDRVGPELALKLYLDCIKVFDRETDKGISRVSNILLAAADPRVRHPEKYVRAALDNSR